MSNRRIPSGSQTFVLCFVLVVGGLLVWLMDTEIKALRFDKASLQEKVAEFKAKSCNPYVPTWNADKRDFPEGALAVTGISEEYQVAGIWYQTVTLQHVWEMSTNQPLYGEPFLVYNAEVPFVMGEPLVGQWCYARTNQCIVPGTNKVNQGTTDTPNLK